MALSILSSNRVETLQQSLSSHIHEQKPAHPFDVETIVVPTFAMARWLNLQIAQIHGIAANIEYPLPANWIWQLATSLLDDVPQKDPLSRDMMDWRIFEYLPGLLDRPEFATLSHYLKDDLHATRRWQLAGRISAVFDRYQHYRPQTIKAWSARELPGWQEQLWQILIRQQPQNHRVAVLGKLVDCLNSNLDIKLLPQRVSIFAVSSLPPIFIDIIQALANHIEVRLYQHSPTDQYWADLKSQKARSRIRLSNAQQAEYFDTGNELLASWGRQGQVMQDLLLEHDSSIAIELESSQAPGNSTLLHCIQQSIFDLDESKILKLRDDSLSIHICHSPMRECQVLHDQLLAMFDRDAALSPEQVLVMVPEISRYAPYIEAVFRPDENATRPNLPWNLSDISLADEHPLVMIFLQLLKLPDSRFAYSEIISFLDIEEIRHRFEVDERALDDIHSLLLESQVRWGIDSKHKLALGLPPTVENTWQQARHRIFAGYALGESEYWNGIAPLNDVDGRCAENIGKFWLLFERLEYWRMQLQETCTAAQWQDRLNRLLGDFFVEQDLRAGHLQQIRDAIDNLKPAGTNKISASLLFLWMQQQLSNVELPGRLFSGGITFCGMRPMRSLPFKVICLLGMNDSAFPRRENPVEFDLMSHKWQPGDPAAADEDRYLMLETLLCARQKLYISYCGRSLKDNSSCQPSVLVRELLDFVDNHFVSESLETKTPGMEKFSNSITTVHAMQAFSSNNYSGGLASYDSYWCRIANQMRDVRHSMSESSWPETVLPEVSNPGNDISIKNLQRFLSHPVQYFFNHRLNIWLTRDRLYEDDEPFDLDALQKWQIKQQIAEASLQQKPVHANLIQAEARLPHGQAATDCLDEIQHELESVLTGLEYYRGANTRTITFDHRFESGNNLSGAVERYYPGKGLMHFTPSGLKGKYLLALWVDHLVLCAGETYSDDETGTLIWRDGSLNFTRLEVTQAINQLEDYTLLFLEGQNRPLPVFPAASYAWAQQDEQAKALKKALAAWHGVEYLALPGDKHDPYIALSQRGLTGDPLPDAFFETCASRIYSNALDNGVEL